MIAAQGAAPLTIHDVYQPMSRYFRSRRMEHFRTLFHITSRTRILDDGGTEFNWELISVRPSLRILNLRFAKIPVRQSHYVVGNGLQIPFRDRAFDIVFSNSVIEHVGDEANIQAFADEIRRCGERLLCPDAEPGFSHRAPLHNAFPPLSTQNLAKEPAPLLQPLGLDHSALARRGRRLRRQYPPPHLC